ncbi:MAG: HAMP domain-containing sensor histidine kinase [Bacteroidales bacterium]
MPWRAIRNYNLKSDREKTDEYLRIASGEILRLETLISRVLDNNMIEQGEEILRPENTDLVMLVRDVVESVRDRAEKPGARIGVSVPPQPVELFIDPLYVRGVIFNLVDNSLKYATKEPVIEVTIIPGEGYTELSVRDNGPGIPEEYRERVFEKFFRVPGGDTHNVKGYGLGLSYVSLVMKLHGGTARVESLPGETVFTIRFEGLKG